MDEGEPAAYVGFQFSPLREGRRRFCCGGKPKVRFQFSPLREGRLHQGDVREVMPIISILAPARGATIPQERLSVRRNFNSRPCERGDTDNSEEVLAAMKFQFSPLREGRQPGEYRITKPDTISILAPARGATLICDGAVRSGKFQFSPLREGRPLFHVRLSSPRIFQFSPLREGRHWAGRNRLRM